MSTNAVRRNTKSVRRARGDRVHEINATLAIKHETNQETVAHLGDRVASLVPCVGIAVGIVRDADTNGFSKGWLWLPYRKRRWVQGQNN
jgi:hypothetical protein